VADRCRIEEGHTKRGTLLKNAVAQRIWARRKERREDMKRTLALRTRSYLVRIGILLIVIALGAGTVSCGGAGREHYLTVAVAPPGDGSANDLTDDAPYAPGTKIVLQALAAADCQFIQWSAPAGTFADINAATTTFTMPAQHVTVTANFAQVHSLTVAAHPVGAGTATDLTNCSPYPAGAGISIKAIASPSYQFVSWSATAGTFANASAEETTFTMPDRDVTVAAIFGGSLDLGTCYLVDSGTAPYVGEVVYLEDQFGAVNATLELAWAFGNPAENVYDGVLTQISNPDHHFVAYEISYEGEPQEWFVEVSNHIGAHRLIVSGPIGLAIPTQKAGHEAPVGLDHYLFYEVVAYELIEGPSGEVSVDVSDQFGDHQDVSVHNPMVFGNPVRKTHGDEVTEIVNPQVHAVLYQTTLGGIDETVEVVNQFGEQILDLYGPMGLAVSSQKMESGKLLGQPEQPLAVAAVLGDYGYQLIQLLRANNFSAEARDWDVVANMGDYDVVVVNRPEDPGATEFQAFLDAASDSEVGLVFTSSYHTGSSWGISLLEWYSVGPAGQEVDYYDGDVYYRVAEEHPIFDGWDVDDEITIITGGDRDHSWFWDYSGTTTAEVASAYSGIRGDAVALGTYGGSTHVLLASLGPQSYTGVADWTDDAETIFINAVAFAASSPP
jgi:hypothetical protein